MAESVPVSMLRWSEVDCFVVGLHTTVQLESTLSLTAHQGDQDFVCWCLSAQTLSSPNARVRR